jgi:hypothetical protein
VTPKKSLEDILAEYAEDLVAERKPRLAEDVAALNEEERLQLTVMLALVRRLKAAHREAPPPREEFIARLDDFVREEIARQIAPEAQAAQSGARFPETGRSAAASEPLIHRLLGAGRALLQATIPIEVGARWRLAGVAALVLVLGLHVQLYLQVRRLERHNQTLVARLERETPPGALAPLGLPRGQGPDVEKDAPSRGSLSVHELVAGVELRLRIEKRIGELEKEAETKTGRDRENAGVLLRELRALLQSSSRP